MAVAVGVASAILMGIAGRLAQHRRAVWISAALALYSVTVVPFGTVQVVSEQVGLTMSSPLVADWTVIGLLTLAIRPPRIVDGLASWALAVCGLVLTLATGGLVRLALGTAQFAKFSTLAHPALVTTVCALAAVLAINSFLERHGLLRPARLGLLVIAAAHLCGLIDGVPTSESKLTFLAPRLFGLVLLLRASAQLAQRAWHEFQSKCDAQQTELDIRATHLTRMAYETAERHHELRNGLASLAGYHLLLDKSLDADETAQLRRAAASELGRMEAMLERPCAVEGPEGYLVAPILMDLVALRRSAGHDVALEVDERLTASGSPEVFAQVVTNLLANCERHAPGSSVRIRASGDRDRVLVEVADGGPGVPPGLRRVALHHGVRGGRTGGSGLGLYICAKLLNAQGVRCTYLTPVQEIRGARCWSSCHRRPIAHDLGQPPDQRPHWIDNVATSPSWARGHQRARRPRTVLVIDDHELFSISLVIALRCHGVKAEQVRTASMDAILGALHDLPAGLAVLDLDLGRDTDGRCLNGCDLVGALRRQGWKTIVVSGSSDQCQIAATIAAGAIGFVPKSASLDALLSTILLAATGEAVMPANEHRMWRELHRDNLARKRELTQRLERLTNREWAVLEMLAEGHRAAAISDKSVVSLATVRSQIQSILSKLTVNSQLEAVALIREHRHGV